MLIGWHAQGLPPLISAAIVNSPGDRVCGSVGIGNSRTPRLHDKVEVTRWILA